MTLIEACDELRNVVHSAVLVVDAYEKDPDDYTALVAAVEELQSEFNRIGGED